MKKLFLLALLIQFGLRAAAQTVTITELTAPCDSNGVLVATFTGMPTPYTVTWASWSSYPYMNIVHYGVTGTTDTLYGYTGGEIEAVGYDSITSTYVMDSTNFAPPFNVSATSTPGICPALATVSATVTGGTAPFTYKWLDYSSLAVVATGNPAGVPAGTYLVRVTDASGCVSGYSTFLPEVSVTPDFTQTVTATAAVCPVSSSATATTTGGVSPFSYFWQNLGTLVTTTVSSPSINLPPGLYKETATDAIGCVSTYDVVVTYTPDFTATVTTTDADCTNGTASVNVTGGVAPFSYLWSNGATTPSISGLVMGNYSLMITDALGCVDSSGIDTTSALTGYVAQTITIDAPDVTTPATCIDADGSITAFGSGGTPPYSYLWSNGGTTATISGLTSNYYSVAITDANGCIGSGGDYVSSSTPITDYYNTTPSSCTSPTGSATLVISGGTPPYTINWNTTPAQTGTTATSLAPGSYYFHIVDAAGCTQSGVVTVPPIDVINLSFNSTPATCLASDGSVAVFASGGVAPYTYSWTGSSSTASALTGMPYGLYYATVTDANGCSVTNCQHIPYSSPLELGLSSVPASCLYTADGTIVAAATMGTPPYTYSMGGSASGPVTVGSLATGSYWVYVSDALGCSAMEYTYVDYNVLDSSCFCVVKGTVYNDINQNCIQDPGEHGIQNIQLHCAGLGYTYTDTIGNYYFLVPSGTYTVSQTVLSEYPLSPCQPNHIPYTSVAATGCYTTINFGDTLTPIHDMHICTWDYTGPRPGFPYTQTTIVSNHGTVPEPSILASYVPDGQIYSPTFVPSGVFSGAPYYYYTPAAAFGLNPGVNQQFLTTYNVPADIPLGTNVIFKDSVAYTSPMSNWLNDYSPWDNVEYFTTTTVGSFDPNFKEVSPKGAGPQGYINTSDSVLEYMVHFQNTGSFMAENVVVKDTLSANLDWTSLRPDFMSAQCVVDVDEHGVATFTFNNIDLPPVSAEPITSNGLFTYTIKQKPGLAIGTQIKNSASIYFDFNAPILTNKTLNTIGSPVSVPAAPIAAGANNSFAIYPNPAQTSFTAVMNLNNSGDYSLTVSDVTGKTEITQMLHLQQGSQKISVDAGNLASGVYFVTFYGSDKIGQTQKLVIIH